MFSADPVAAAAACNLALVAQGLEVIDRLGAEAYARPVAACFQASAGGHFRHAIEHYQSLLAALAGAELDYENRPRDSLIETQSRPAVAAWRHIAAELQPMADGKVADRALVLAAESCRGAALATSLARELEFLINHTVHHFALIAVIVRLQGMALPADFGLAPSTLRHRQTLDAACAR